MMNHSLEITEDEPDTRLEEGTLAFGVEAKEDSEAGAYIKSWANATRGDSQLTKSSTVNMEESVIDSSSIIPELKFEVVYARTIESPKKHVAYTVMVRKDGAVPDPHPSVIERRYTEFLELFTALRQENSLLLSTFAFPKKALIGNFTPEMISSRSAGFEAFLMLIAANEKLKNSAAVIDFLMHREYSEARHWIEEKRYDQAVPLLENCFRLLNKLHTDRHPTVLRTLCLLVACCEAGNDKQTERFAEIALRRYEAVSDADLLQYYVPLLQLCVHHYWSTDNKGDVACWRTCLAFFNIVLVVTGCVVIVVGWWMKYCLSKFLEFSVDFTSELPFLIVLIGFLFIFIGCSASVCIEKPLLQITYGGCLILFFMLEVVLIIFLIVYQQSLRDSFGRSLNESITNYKTDLQQQQHSVMDLVQSKLECCGYSGYYDWYCSPIRKVPPSCCKRSFCDTSRPREIFLSGCYDKVFQYVNSNMTTVLGVMSLAAILPLVGAFLAFCLAYHVFTLYYQPVTSFTGNI